MNIVLVRKRLGSLHSALRNEGMNPLEAVAVVAAAIGDSGYGETELARLSPGVRDHIKLLASDVEADGSMLSIAFQEFLLAQARYGLGQYLTPLPVADFIPAVLSDAHFEIALDPFMGSALLLERIGHRWPHANLIGVEINHAAATIARAVGTLTKTGIDICEGDAFSLWATGQIPKVDLVVTNPPYGALATTVSVADLKSLGVPDSLLRLKKIPAELLGLELSMSVLNKGGLLGIVLPQSVLTNTSWAAYRADVFSRLRLLNAVSLPEQTFAPFRGVAKACVLIGRKESVSLPVSFPYVRSQSIGWDDTGRPSGVCDLPEIAEVLLDGDVSDGAEMDHNGVVSLFPALNTHRPVDSWVRLGDVSKVFTGRTLARNDYVPSGPRLLKVGDLAGSFISWKDRARTCVPKESFDRWTQYHLQVGDICLTAAAHRPRYIGLKVDLVDTTPDEGAMPSAEVMVIRLSKDAPITQEQLLYYLRSSTGYTQIQDLVRGSTAHLYPMDVEQMLVPRLLVDDNAIALRERHRAAATAFRDYLRLESEARRLSGFHENDSVAKEPDSDGVEESGLEHEQLSMASVTARPA